MEIQEVLLFVFVALLISSCSNTQKGGSPLDLEAGMGCDNPEYGATDHTCMAIADSSIRWCELDLEDKNSCEDRYALHQLLYNGARVVCGDLYGKEEQRYCELFSKNASANLSVCVDDEQGRGCFPYDGIFLRDASLCGNQSRGWCQDFIYYAEAHSKKNISICMNIQKPSYEQKCIAILKKDFRLCPLLSCNITKEMLALDIGVNSLNIRECEKIKYKDVKKACVSVIESNLGSCLDVKQRTSRMICALNIIEREKDVSLCKLLPSTEEIKECNRYFDGWLS